MIITMIDLPRELIQHEINKYLVEIDRQILRKVCTFFSSLFPYKSIEFNDMNVDLELVHVKRYQKYWNKYTMNKVAEKGDLESLKYLLAPPNGKQCPWDFYTTICAANNGHLECLKYLYENGCPCGTNIIEFAAMNGHLECIKYLHSQGCKWDSWTTAYAAEGGYLQCLKYLHENGCPWDSKTIEWAFKKGHLRSLKYARENGCPIS